MIPSDMTVLHGPITHAAIKLVYLDREGLPTMVPAEVVTKHPNETITFSVTSVEWKTRTGWKPDSHVEVQAYPLGQINKPDNYYWGTFYPATLP